MLFAHLGFFISFLKLYKSSPWFCNTVLKLDFQKMIPGTEKERERERGGGRREIEGTVDAERIEIQKKKALENLQKC